MTEPAVLLGEIMEDVDLLTDWETDFVASIESQLEQGRGLSEKQAAVLEALPDRLERRRTELRRGLA